jgi:hypothetical protein
MHEQNVIKWLKKTPIFKNFKLSELAEIASVKRQFLKFNQGKK